MRFQQSATADIELKCNKILQVNPNSFVPRQKHRSTAVELAIEIFYTTKAKLKKKMEKLTKRDIWTCEMNLIVKQQVQQNVHNRQSSYGG